MALVVVLAMSVPLMPAIWSALATEKPMSEERAANLIQDAKAQQMRLRNDTLRDLMHCQETHAGLGAEMGRLCLEMATMMNKDRMKEIRDLDRDIAEWRTYEPR